MGLCIRLVKGKLVAGLYAETKIPQVESALKEAAAVKAHLEADVKQAQTDRAEAKLDNVGQVVSSQVTSRVAAVFNALLHLDPPSPTKALASTSSRLPSSRLPAPTLSRLAAPKVNK